MDVVYWRVWLVVFSDGPAKKRLWPAEGRVASGKRSSQVKAARKLTLKVRCISGGRCGQELL